MLTTLSSYFRVWSVFPYFAFLGLVWAHPTLDGVGLGVGLWAPFLFKRGTCLHVDSGPFERADDPQKVWREPRKVEQVLAQFLRMDHTDPQKAARACATRSSQSSSFVSSATPIHAAGRSRTVNQNRKSSAFGHRPHQFPQRVAAQTKKHRKSPNLLHIDPSTSAEGRAHKSKVDQALSLSPTPAERGTWSH